MDAIFPVGPNEYTFKKGKFPPPPKKTVDITEHCPGMQGGRRCLLVYCQTENGLVVGIVLLPTGPSTEDNTGTSINFLVDKLGMEVPPPHDTLALWAGWLGLEKPALRTLIETHAPPA